MLSSEHIKRLAAGVGFDLCGIARAMRMDDDAAFLRGWIERGFSSSLGYMERHADKRADVGRLVEGARSVVVCAVGYKNAASGGYDAAARAKVASYACCKDYHDTIKRMLGQMCSRLKESAPSLVCRTFTDSAPLFEKRYAVEAGLGWIGRQSLLVTPQLGTYVLLGEIVISEECDAYDAPLAGVGCGACRRCAEACPNGAVCERHIDTSKCISRATVERGGDASLPLHGWIFGCDECQSCCPYNLRAPMHRCAAFDPLFDPAAMDAEAWASMSEAEFAGTMAQTPLARSGLARIKANLERE